MPVPADARRSKAVTGKHDAPVKDLTDSIRKSAASKEPLPTGDSLTDRIRKSARAADPEPDARTARIRSYRRITEEGE
jgi:hypothetical protein